MSDDCLPIPALTLGQIASLLNVHYVTVCRWREPDAKNALPDPDFVPAGNQKRALWAVDTILVWASERGMSWDEAALRRIVSTS